MRSATCIIAYLPWLPDFANFFFLDLLFQFEQGLVCLAVQCGLTRTDILMFIVLMIWSSPCRRQCTKSNIMTCAPVQKRVVAFPVHYGFFFCSNKVQTFWGGHKNEKKIFHSVLIFLKSINKWKDCFQTLWLPHNIWTLRK